MRPGGPFGGVAFAQNVWSQDEVDGVLSLAVAAGGTPAQPARLTFYGGYAGVFTDPDGHAWEISHNPGFALNEDGTVTLPDFSAM